MEINIMAKPGIKPEMQPCALLIEHDPELRRIMIISLEQSGMKVIATSRFAHALQVLQQETHDLFLTDIDLGDGDPGRLITAFRRNKRSGCGAVVVTTACRLEDGWRRKHKPDAVIYKPFDIRHMIRLMWALLEKKSDRV
jgi:DNA-binding response OmpR family regulator